MSGVNNDRRAPQPTVKILLVCGHTVMARDRPWRPDTTFGCRMGTGCGYRLGWVSCVDVVSGIDAVNPRYASPS
jgi:hypothetical protein